MNELVEYTDDEVESGINMLINSGNYNYLPKSFELAKYCEANIQRVEPKAVPCFVCASFGYVYGVIGVGGREQIRPMTMKCKPVEGYHYHSIIMGRCSCLNGERLSSKMPVVKPLPDVNQMAKSEDRDCVYITDRWAD